MGNLLYLTYLIELRQRLLYCVICFTVCFAMCYCYANPLLSLLISPLQHSLKNQAHLIATQVTAPLLAPLHLALNAALLASTPFSMYQLWRFVHPALHPPEQHLACLVVIFSLILFLCGLLFGFYIVLPAMFYCFSQALPLGINYRPDVQSALSFIISMLQVFGMCFQLPLLCVLVVRFQVLGIAQLKTMRPYVIVAAFVVGMIFTPPDVLLQIMLAVPLCLLYELGILLVLFFT